MPFPINVTVSWDANPLDEEIQVYDVTLDGVGVGTVPATTLSLVVPIPHSGTYAFGVVATNVWGTSIPTIVTKKITPPSAVGGVKVVKT